MSACRTFTTSLCVGLLIAAVSADVVINTNGRRFEGQITRETGAGVTMILSGGLEVTIPNSRVQEIERQELWENMILLGDHQAQQGNLQRAAERYEQALQANPPAEQLDMIRERIAAVQASISEALDQVRAQEIETLQGLLRRAREQLAEGNWERALESLDTAMTLHPEAGMRERLDDLRADALYAKAYSLYDRRDPVSAVVVLNELLALDPIHANGRALNERIVEEQPLDTPEVVAELERIVAQDPSRLDLRVRLGDHHMRRRDFAAALPHLMAAAESPLHYDQIREHLRTVMLDRVNRAAAASNYDEAINIYEQVLERFPQEDPNYLNVLIYRRESNSIPEGDLDARMDLAQQVLDLGYEAWAKEQMNQVLSADPNHAEARQMHYQFARESLNEGLTAMNQENLTLARAKLIRFIEEYEYQDLNETANIQLANIDRRIAEQQRSQAERAQEFRQLGDEYYAQARRNYETWRNTRESEQRTNVYIRTGSQLTEITHFYEQAIFAFEEAIDLDPSLRPVVGLRLADARDELRRLTTGRIPPREPWLSRN